MRRPKRLRLLGVDHDPDAVAGARTNIAAAGLEGLVEVDQGDALTLELKRGWNAVLLTNPPYGERVGNVRQLRDLYARFGERLRREAGGYRYCILCGNPQLAAALKLEAASELPLRNGPIDCSLICGEVPVSADGSAASRDGVS